MSELKDGGVVEIEPLRKTRTPRVVSGMNKPYKPKPLGEQSRALRRQAIMVIFGNLGVLSSGMSLGLPTITSGPMKDVTAPVHFTDSEFSWFGKGRMGAAVKIYFISTCTFSLYSLFELVFGSSGWLTFRITFGQIWSKANDVRIECLGVNILDSDGYY